MQGAVKGAAEAAIREAALPGDRELYFQLSWETVPGLHGLRCEGFRALLADQPDLIGGVAANCADRAETERLVAALEAHFTLKRFSNDAAAFEAVRAFVLAASGDRTE